MTRLPQLRGRYRAENASDWQKFPVFSLFIREIGRRLVRSRLPAPPRLKLLIYNKILFVPRVEIADSFRQVTGLTSCVVVARDHSGPANGRPVPRKSLSACFSVPLQSPLFGRFYGVSSSAWSFLVGATRVALNIALLLSRDDRVQAVRLAALSRHGLEPA